MRASEEVRCIAVRVIGCGVLPFYCLPRCLMRKRPQLRLHPTPPPPPPPSHQMPLRRRLSRRARNSVDTQSMNIGAAARAATPVALTALVQSTAVFPPLKSAVNFLLQVHDICEKMKSNREGADELRVRVEGVRDFVEEAFQEEEDMSTELYDALVQFDEALTNTLVAVDDVRWRKSRISRLAFSARDAETLCIVRQRLDDAMKLLKLIVTLHLTTTLGAISRTLDTTVMSVSRVEGLVFEVRHMKA